MHEKLESLYVSMGLDDQEVWEEELTMHNAVKFMSMLERLTQKILVNHKMISS